MIMKFKLFENDSCHFDYDPLEIFNIGDRVVCDGHYGGLNFDNKEGFILKFYKSGGINEILVKFDIKFNGLSGGDGGIDPEKRSAYLSYGCVKLIDNTPPKIRWYKKGKLHEGIRWYSKGKLSKPEENLDGCDHVWIKRSQVIFNPDNFSSIRYNYKICKKCGEKILLNKETD